MSAWAGGFDQFGPAGPAHDRAKRGEEWIPLRPGLSSSLLPRLQLTYDSADLLDGLLKQSADLSDPTRYVVLYLAGRTVGQVALEAGQPDRWQYLTTDHLGTPLVITDAVQAMLGTNGFLPFGEDLFADTGSSALSKDIFLRFPGQWEDDIWQEAMRGASAYYNVYRWYTPATGRYSRTDPLGRNGDPHPYLYALANPLNFIDPLGLKVRVCCKAIPPTLYGSVAVNIQYGLNTSAGLV